MRIRGVLFIAVALVASLVPAAPASALQHFIRVEEIFAGTEELPGAQFVELKMLAAGQTQVEGHAVRVFSATGTRVADFAAFPGNVTNGVNGSRLLLCTASAQKLFGITCDAVATTGRLVFPSGKVVFDGSGDTVTYGDYRGPTTGSSMAAGFAVRTRSLVRKPTDTNNSYNDFRYVAPTPQNNAGTEKTLPGGDADGDVVQDGADNCPHAANGGQEDADADGLGDACDKGPVPMPAPTATTPVSPSNVNSPKVRGTAPAGTTVRLFTDATCASAVAAQGTAAAFTSGPEPGLRVTVPSNSTTRFRATARDLNGNQSRCSSASVVYVEDSTPPQTTITSGPSGSGNTTTARFTFASSEPGSFQCSLDGVAFSACVSPRSLSGLTLGGHTFRVRARDRAGNVDATPASRSWTVGLSVAVADFEYTPAAGSIHQGAPVRWAFQDDPVAHSATDRTGLGLYNSGIRTSGTFDKVLTVAGRYPYGCDVHPIDMNGSVSVRFGATPLSGTTATVFTLRWSTGALPANTLADVQIERPDSPGFVSLVTATNATSRTFTPDAGPGIYRFRSRLTKGAFATGFSPAAAITVS